MWRRQQIRSASLLAELVYREINEAGCATSSVLMGRLHVTHNELFYALDRLRKEGRVEAVGLGRAAFWCTNRATAEDVLSKLADALKSLLCGRIRFTTPKKALYLITKDPETQKLFSRYMQLYSNPVTVQIIDALMARAFGEPVKTGHNRLYHIQCIHRVDTPTGID